MGAVSRGQKGAGRTPRSLRPEISPAGFIGHPNNPRSASSPAEPSTTKEPALPGAGTKPRRSNYSLVVCAWCCLSPPRIRLQARTFEGLARSSDRLVPSPAPWRTSQCRPVAPCDTPPEHEWCPASHAPDNSWVSTLTVEPDGRPTTECDVETNRPARVMHQPAGILALRHRLESVSSGRQVLGWSTALWAVRHVRPPSSGYHCKSCSCPP
jgi:hypothetical protein